MTQLKAWQWLVLSLPLVAIAGFFLTAASWQIHQWNLNWVWGLMAIVLVGWRWLLVKWTAPANRPDLDVPALDELLATLETVPPDGAPDGETKSETPAEVAQVERELQSILKQARQDAPVWEDWSTFWQRCLMLVEAIAKVDHPDVKDPLLNIYSPQAYGLIRGTVDDMDRWMQQLQPVLGQVTVGQAYRGYETYRQLEPTARKILSAWNWAQWVLNPLAALAKELGRESTTQANQQLLANLNQLLREAALHNLCKQAIALYGAEGAEVAILGSAIAEEQTRTLKSILAQAEPDEAIVIAPVKILMVGRTGAGKSSLINSLFQTDLAEVNVLPSTSSIQAYEWMGPEENGERLILWDTPGYEQVGKGDYLQQVLDYAGQADVLLLVNPALDPALQMDADFLQQMVDHHPELPTIAVVTQVDRLRPLREWDPPYDWREGDRLKERNIREAIAYRIEELGDRCELTLPVVNGDRDSGRDNWGIDELSVALLDSIDPAKQIRLARCLRDREARTIAAAKVIDRYSFQMTTTQGLAGFVKSPILQAISTVVTGSPALAHLLAEEIPVEVLPTAIGKVQMAYELVAILGDREQRSVNLLELWPLIVNKTAAPDRDAWAFGHAIVEYWQQDLGKESLLQRYETYLKQG